jgi:hypothetical protein
MRKNKYYNIYTDKEIPDRELRSAVNCWLADLIPCDDHRDINCHRNDYFVWKKCPKHSGNTYIKKEKHSEYRVD